MSESTREATQVTTRLLKCALEIEEARAYWAHADGCESADAERAFAEYWFGARSLSRIEVLLANMRVRFDAFPGALETLHQWRDMSPDTRRVICHWHLQLADPLYRAFTGDYLVSRRKGPRVEVTRDLVVSWTGGRDAGRWTMATRIQFASKLLSAAYSAGLVGRNRDPRPVVIPRVPDEALEYLMYLLRNVQFEGTLLQNAYVASVGYEGAALEDRLRSLSGLAFRRQGDLLDFGWRYPDLRAWAAANQVCAGAGLHGRAR
jgi:hypothetical protein